MSRFTRRTALAAAATIALLVGAGAALAATNGNDDVKRAATRLAAKSTFQAEVAKQLGTTVAKLETAVRAAALARVAAAEKAGDVTAAEADALEQAIEDGRLARRLALPADVAKELGTTEEKLTQAVTTARKAQLKARVDQAVADKKITPEYGEQLKQRIDDATFPGRGGKGPGFGPGRHGSRFGFGFGRGFGPPPGAPAQGNAPAALVF